LIQRFFMTRSGLFSLTAGLLFALTQCWAGRAEENSQPTEFKEVYDLVRKHLPGISEAELDRAAVQALVSGLGQKVMLVSADSGKDSAASALVSRTNLFDGQIAYVRVSRVAEGLPQAIRQAYEHLRATNELSGIIIDLRFADGLDYAAAAGVADMFQAKERPLLDWGEGVKRSKEKADALTLPVAVMVNHETAGAAEALAAVLRETGSGLILGSRTAGKAMIAQDYPLTGGDHLRIAISPIHLGDGSDLASEGLKPDIQVAVSPSVEKSYFTDAFKEPGRTNALSVAGSAGTNTVAATNRVRRLRFNEAELVRERKEGFLPEADAAVGGEDDPDRPVVRDPVLARALDVLKGLAVVRRARS
jgi:hypothetical protein